MQLPLYRDIDKKHHKLSNIIEIEIKTVSILKNDSMKIVYLLLLLLISLQTLASSKNYVSIFASFITGLSKIGFLN